MDTARDIALIVLVVEALILGLAVFAAGIAGSVAIIEFTVHIRRGLRRTARGTDKVNQNVERLIDTRVLAPTIKYQRYRIMSRVFSTHLMHGAPSSDAAPENSPEAG